MTDWPLPGGEPMSGSVRASESGPSEPASAGGEPHTGELYVIERWVQVDAPPIRVAAELAMSQWRSAYRIEPAGAGSRVLITARIGPEALARAVEEATLGEVCGLSDRIDASACKEPTRQIVNPRRKTMTTIERHITIEAPPEKVWPALADFGGVSIWNPNVKASRLTSSQGEGAGTSRECQLSPMGTVQERVLEWDEGSMLSIEIYEFKNVPAMRRAVATIGIAAVDEDSPESGTEVTIRMNYEVGLGAMGAGMNTLMLKRQFGSSVAKLLAGLKLHVETGRPVDKGAKLPLAAVA